MLKMATTSVSNTKGGMAGSYNLQSQDRRESLEAEAMEEAVCRIKFSFHLPFRQVSFFLRHQSLEYFQGTSDTVTS